MTGAPVDDRPVAAHHPDHPAYADALPVPFAAADGGSAPMTWGQRAIWESIQWLAGEDQFFNGATVIDLPAPARTADLLAAVHDLTVLHQSLRSTYPVGTSGPVQVVRRDGVVPVGVVDAPTDAGPDEVRALADRVCAELGAVRFDERELAWRCVAVRADGAVAHLVLVASHQVIDGWSFDLLVAALRDGTSGSTPAPATRPLQPLDQARYEQSEPAVRRDDGSQRYWEQTLTRVAPEMFDGAAGAPEPLRFVKVALVSRAAAVAGHTLAARLGVSTGVVTLAVTALALSAVTGHGEVVLCPILANRFDRDRRGLLAPVAQDGLFTLDVEGAASVDALLRTAQQQALACYHHGYYDPVRLRRTVESVEQARGARVRLMAFLNDTRPRREQVVAATSDDELVGLRAESRLQPVGAWDRVDATFFVAVGAEPDGAWRIELLADTAHVPRATIERTLTGIEEVLVAAAFAEVRVEDALGAFTAADEP